FVSLLEFVAFKNSFVLISHSEHLSILLSFILIFLPSGWQSVAKVNKSTKFETLLVFFSCQAFILLTYTMSGIGKIITSITQFLGGKVHILAPQGLAMTIADRLLSIDTTTYLGEWLIEHYYVSLLLMLGTVYLQFFSLFVLFIPSLHQLWACGLILFHVGVFLTLKISFWENCLWLILFMLYSPFIPKYLSWKQTIMDLPLFGWILAKI
ncbi:MAG: hypothetical protein F6K24_56805, partial [Okeania sp. SIO2D1]|nr:hypothetical protein [Okeania sp. SIO2D1]